MRWLVVMTLVTGCAEGILPAPDMGIAEVGFSLPSTDSGGPAVQDSARPMDQGRPQAVRDMFVPPVRDMAPPMPDQGPAVPATCRAETWTLSINGQNRTVRFEVPAAPTANAPRVLLFHGNGDNAANFCATTNLCRFLTDRGALVVVPDGRLRQITVGDQQADLAWDAYDPEPTNEDVTLVSAMLEETTQRCGGGPVFVWGHSQGGYFGFMVAMTNDVRGAVIGAASDPMPGWPWASMGRFPVALLIGTLDFNIEGARTTAQWLMAAGHQVLLKEIEGAEHGGYLSGHDPELANFIGLR